MTPAITNSLTTLVRSVLHGISQVFLQDNAMAGLLMLLGIAVYSPRMAGLVLLGSTIQTGFAALTGHTADARRGLMGYNGALVGAAAHLDLAATWPALWTTILGSLACIPLHLGIAKLSSTRPLARWQLPVLTAPFCLTAGAMVTITHELTPHESHLTTAATFWRGSELGLLNSLSEVFLADWAIAGLVIFAGLVVADRSAAAYAVLGAVVAIATGWIEHADPTSLSGGLLGYSAVLTAIALGRTFTTQLRPSTRLALAIAGVIASVGLRALLQNTPIPLYTWPFILVTWAAIALTHTIRHRTHHDTKNT